MFRNLTKKKQIKCNKPQTKVRFRQEFKRVTAAKIANELYLENIVNKPINMQAIRQNNNPRFLFGKKTKTICSQIY